MLLSEYNQGNLPIFSWQTLIPRVFPFCQVTTFWSIRKWTSTRLKNDVNLQGKDGTTVVIMIVSEKVRYFCKSWRWLGLIYDNIFLVRSEINSFVIDHFSLCTIFLEQGKMWQCEPQWKHYIYQAYLVTLQEFKRRWCSTSKCPV